MKRLQLAFVASLALLGSSSFVLAAGLSESIEVLRSVGPEGQGNVAASAAWDVVSRADAQSLPDLLAAMDGANELAINWLRSAVETVADRARSKGQSLPIGALEKFVRDHKHHPRARRLAYDLIASADSGAAEKLMAKMLDDPSPELRREAVQRLMAEAAELRKSGKTNAAVARYESALKPARDLDQIEAIAKALRELNKPVELREVFGWIANWHVIGPFDNTGGAGYARIFPPEEKVDLNAEYDGKSGKVRWKDFATSDDHGKVDFNKPLGSLKEVTGYAWTEIQCDKARSAEVRLGCKNGWKVWLNGELLFGRDEYHRGTEIDHYRMPAQLKAGKNTILVKLCQNELTPDWAKEWEFQLRITDSIGTPVVLAKR